MLEERDLIYVIESHRNSEQKKRTRYWDGKTPYHIHPIWCATTLLHETFLPEGLRQDGSQALLYHDILEDTSSPLPGWLSERVKELVRDLTFENSQQEMEQIWAKTPEVRLLKLYDKTSNLMDGVWMDREKRERYAEYTSKLCQDVEQNYGKLNITRIAKAII